MSQDVECPYCHEWQEINHDDGFGYQEGVFHKQDCGDCGKTFVFTTQISFDYEATPADCLNDGEHNWQKTRTHPLFLTKMECKDCGKTRPPTQSEWKEIGVDPHQDQELFYASLKSNT